MNLNGGITAFEHDARILQAIASQYNETSMEHAAPKRAAIALWYVSTTNYEGFTIIDHRRGRVGNVASLGGRIACIAPWMFPELASRFESPLEDVDSLYTLGPSYGRRLTRHMRRRLPMNHSSGASVNTRAGAVIRHAPIAPMMTC